jgi:3-hydroxyisobutyrate dehydrogenase
MHAPRIAFLGLGIMGGGMARRLISAGFAVTVYNRSPDKTTPLAKAGAQVAATARDAAKGADVVFGMVADDTASRALWLGENGALVGAARGAVLVECSTLTVEWVRELAQAAQARGCAFVDAPVTGSKGAAANGELNFLVGGEAAAVEKIRPALAAMSKSITHLGPSGSGALVKLINNFVCGVQVASIAEALAWIERAGLDRAKAQSVLLDGAPGSPLVKTIAARINAGDYTPNFLLPLMAKDLGYAIKESAAAGHPLKTPVTALEIFQNAIAAGLGEKDMAAVVEPLRQGKR